MAPSTLSKNKIALVTSGDPSNPKTLSGWSTLIIQEFEKRGVEVVGIDANIAGNLSKAFWYFLYQAWRFRPSNFTRAEQFAEQLRLMTGYTKSDFQRMRAPQARRAQHVIGQLRALGICKALHHVQSSIPTDGQPDSDIEHYLLLDSTWHIESVNQSFRNRFTPGIVRAFQESERDAFARVRHFFPVSEYVAQDLIDYYRIPTERVTVVGSGWGQISPFWGNKDYAKGPIFCSAKMRFEDKGGQLLIDAFRIAKQRMPHLRLVLVGQDYYRNRIGDVPGLTLLGHIPWEELQALFKESALFAMPAYSEPWGMVYLEALISRTPILGLKRTAMPEITGNGRFGFMVDSPEPEAVADALVDAMSDPERLRSMGEAGQQFVLDRYSWPLLISRISEGMQL